MAKPNSTDGYKYGFGDKLIAVIFVVVVLVFIGGFINTCINPVEETWEEEQRRKADERWGDDDPR